MRHEEVKEMCILQSAIVALRMERQYLSSPAGEQEYISLYRDCQPCQNVYWNAG